MHNSFCQKQRSPEGSKVTRGFAMIALFLLTLTLGCGGGSGISLNGVATVDGEPVPKGSISFSPVRGTSSPTAVAPVAGGEFSVARSVGMKPGTFNVTLRLPPGERAAQPNSEPVTDPANFDLGAAIEQAKANAPKPGKVYEMEVDIKGAADDFELEFTSE